MQRPLRLSRLLLLLLLAGVTNPLYADVREIPDARVIEESERARVFDDYTVHFSVFNSAFVPADVASIYKISRAKNQVLINISVTQAKGESQTLGLNAKVTGTAKNLIQQMQVLDFQTINEGQATYFIAPLKHTNEEVFNFDISVIPEGAEQPLNIKFSRTLYITE